MEYYISSIKSRSYCLLVGLFFKWDNMKYHRLREQSCIAREIRLSGFIMLNSHIITEPEVNWF